VPGKKRRKLLPATPLKVQMALGQVHLEEEDASKADCAEEEAPPPPKARRTGQSPINSSCLTVQVFAQQLCMTLPQYVIYLTTHRQHAGHSM